MYEIEETKTTIFKYNETPFCIKKLLLEIMKITRYYFQRSFFYRLKVSSDRIMASVTSSL